MILIQQVARAITTHAWFQPVVVTVIICNSVTLALETYANVVARFGPALFWLDALFLKFFVAELVLKFIAQGWSEFRRRPWNWFDTIIVGSSLMPLWGNLSALRALRILRLLSMVAEFQHITEALVRAARGAASVFGLLALMLTVLALLSSKLFGDQLPELFGNFHVSFLTHFQLMVFDNWRDVVDTMVAVAGAWAQWYAIVATTISGFILVSLLIGVIVDSLQPNKVTDDA
jgi:voltage-gated sodium channel